MKEQIKDKWVKALMSGDYKQGRGKLKSCDGSFCCLGVLSDLYAKENGVKWKKYDDCFSIVESFDLLPKEVIKWSGMSSESGEIQNELYNNELYDFELAEVNDSGKHTFDQIADIIEEHWKEL